MFLTHVRKCVLGATPMITMYNCGFETRRRHCVVVLEEDTFIQA